MTDPNRPPRTVSPDGGSSGPEDPDSAAPRDPAADRTGEAAGVESSGGGGGDPDALDQSVGRDEAGQGDARTRDGAI
ncbi:hypothetical protein GCM10007859_07730 [Brevundimonas denitrificans]|uniref:Uncharacterized protein n=1 Tax=Brevundimonas denitrificans TaxID=1443434 RepID=A0ABQ6BFE7_9CAUL|nr:hypothetical protein [Brevundimonas denitrificans]GLS00765.1 hypothetical protein GCM10007859_07730 [Brevundimonas denitrificans]